jgi:putative oxidoreductase
MSVALLVLRLVVGLLFAGHGSQKLFGWPRGQGLRATAGFFEAAGLAPGLPLACLAGLAELGGGILLALGLAVPIACLLLVAVMAAAIAVVHWKHGVWAQQGGFEFPLVMAASAFSLAAIGAGRYSLGRAFGLGWHGLGWAIAAALVGAGGALALVAMARLTHRGGVGARPHTA